LRESKNPPFLSVPLNANELLLPAKRAELQELVSFYLTWICTIKAFYVQTGVRQRWRDSRRSDNM